MKSVVAAVAFLAALTAGMPPLAQDGPFPAQQAVASQAELDQLLAPIALYPDDLLGNVLAASTYPLEVVSLQRWLDRNTGLSARRARPGARGAALGREREGARPVRHRGRDDERRARMDAAPRQRLPREPGGRDGRGAAPAAQGARGRNAAGQRARARRRRFGHGLHRARGARRDLRAFLRSARGLRHVVVARLSAVRVGLAVFRILGFRGRRHRVRLWRARGPRLARSSRVSRLARSQPAPGAPGAPG